jgi:hypothetical protein
MDLLEFYNNKSIEIDSDFDENFYQNEYPDLCGYWMPWAKDNGLSDKQRLFHHYYLYGKNEGRFSSAEKKKKYRESEKMLRGRDEDIDLRDLDKYIIEEEKLSNEY